MKNLILNYSVVVAFIGLITISSCKKETTTTDDPNIVHVTLNKAITTAIGSSAVDSIDFNRDGLCEFIGALANAGADTGVFQGGAKSQYSEFAIEGVTPAPYVKTFAKGEAQPTSSSAYATTYYFSIKATGYRVGILDNADKYVSFRFKTGTKYNYGWMKLNLNSAYTEIKIIDYAYSILPDTPIAVGAE